ncbi:MAG: Amino-acid carrier protein AlsT [Chlamydiae bacterium]|nr:Amino-acid carrier protein AlsT [Chlamydiota bacterium]
MKSFIHILDRLENIIWGPPLLGLLLFTGLYLTVRLRFVQFRYLWYSLKLAFTRHDDQAEGDISHFQALMTALAATIGIGSISGVATAIVIGGYGALFWMWVTAFLGMATKYTEALMAIKYRTTDERGEMCGGPMYYLKRGLKLPILPGFFAIAGAVTAVITGNMVQANSVSSAIATLFGVEEWITGLILAFFTAMALIGGIRSIAKVASLFVPFMATLYIVSALVILVMRFDMILPAFYMIFKDAFTGTAAVGGFVGSGMILAVQFGIARGVFTNEAGLGSAPIAAAAAKTDVPGRQALVSMSSVFITTLIVCTLTGLVIGVTGGLGQLGANGHILNGSPLIVWCFDQVIPFGGWLVTIALILFAYSTILGWAYYGEKCFEYLFGVSSTIWYRFAFSLIVIPGAMLSLNLVWKVADIMNGFMVLPNLIGLIGLAKIASLENNRFMNQLHSEGN